MKLEVDDAAVTSVICVTLILCFLTFAVVQIKSCTLAESQFANCKGDSCTSVDKKK